MPALGEEFRSAREARGLTLSDVAEQIHIRSVYLNAIENEEWTSIGAPVYVRGFIRTYARFLGLDAESAVERFNQAAPAAKPASHTISQMSTSDREGSGPSVWAIIATIVAALLVAFVGYEWWSYTQTADSGGRTAAAVTAAPASGRAQPADVPPGSQAPAAVSGSAAPSAAPSGAPPAASRHQLAIRLVQRSWIRVTVDGAQKVEGIFPAGTARTFTGNVADVRAGNAAGVTVSVNGAAPVTLGKEGDVVEQRFTL